MATVHPNRNTSRVHCDYWMQTRLGAKSVAAFRLAQNKEYA